MAFLIGCDKVIILGIDASYTSLGLTKIDLDAKEVFITKLQGSAGSKFQTLYQNAVKKITMLIPLIPTGDFKVMMEEPFPMRESSEKLYLLDGIIMYTLMLKGAKEIWNTNPSYLNTLMGKTRVKSDSVALGKELIKIYQEAGYTFNKSKICDDEAESLMFATRFLIKDRLDDNIASKVIKLNDKFMLEREKLLFIK